MIYPWLLVLALGGVVLNVVAVAVVSARRRAIRRAGFNGEFALRLRAKSRRSWIRLGACLLLAWAAVMPDARRPALFVLALLLVWTSIADGLADVKAEELASERLSLERHR